MPRFVRLATLAGLAAAAAAVGLLTFADLPGQTATKAPPPDGMPAQLAGLLMASSQETCATCHYAWDEPYVLNATRSAPDEEGLAEYRVEIAPYRDYFLWDVRAAPRLPGETPPQDMGVAREIEPALGQAAIVPWRVSGNLTSLAIRVLADDEYARPQLTLTIHGPEGFSATGEGARGHKFLTLESPPPGDYRVEVTYVDGGTATVPAKVHFAETRPGWALEARLPYGEEAAFSWTLPPPGEAGAPEGFQVKFRAFNPHPTELWNLPASYDNAWFTVWVPADAAAPPAPANWTPEEIESTWDGRTAFTLHEENVDVTRVVTRNERGEWGGTGHYFASPPAEAAFPAVPPGTRFLRAELTVEARTPASPAAEFYFTTSRRPDPTFIYPEPTAAKPDGWIVVLPVAEAEWEDPADGTGWFQGFARLALDAQGKAAFDGRYHFVVEALREPPPEWAD